MPGLVKAGPLPLHHRVRCLGREVRVVQLALDALDLLPRLLQFAAEPLRVRAAMKPISTVPRALATVDTASGEAAVAINQRSDVCAVPAAGVVAEAMVALVVADAVLEKFGGDSAEETRRNLASYLKRLADRGLSPTADPAS